MIKIEDTHVYGWEPTIRGMRNPLNSWDKSDTVYGTYWGDIDGHKCFDSDGFTIGKNDLELMNRLVQSGQDHAKFLRMITVYTTITAPLYWWKEFDTYKVGTVANSCSTMHTIHKRPLTLDDFSHEHLDDWSIIELNRMLEHLNYNRDKFLKTKIKRYWWQMIQLLPTSFNQTRTVMLNYQVLCNIHKARKNHKLDEWHDFCAWIERLPYFLEITEGAESAEQGDSALGQPMHKDPAMGC